MVETEYAKALFELATEENKKEAYMDYLNVVFESTQNEPTFMKMMTSPIIELEEKNKIINKVYSTMPKNMIRFLEVLVEHQRFNLIENIKLEYQKLLSNSNNVLNVEIISFEKLTKKELSSVVSNLEKKYPSKKLVVENKVNPDILYGIQIYCNGESIDMSVKNMLNRLKDSL
ncbi:MAG: ATP synthase F1 subunit delta [Anaeroplasmataceae bacterium]|nr:ATP synthase F1 subunit delta [Anaeroplasmataceae bacterium]MDE5867739.1 ATP synthase F1 subunit delta [Anaeroplasmataceae bacterium]